MKDIISVGLFIDKNLSLDPEARRQTALAMSDHRLVVARRDAYKGTPGSCLAVRIVSEVLTLSTLGAGVSLPVRNSWKL